MVAAHAPKRNELLLFIKNAAKQEKILLKNSLNQQKNLMKKKMGSQLGKLVQMTQLLSGGIALQKKGILHMRHQQAQERPEEMAVLTARVIVFQKIITFSLCTRKSKQHGITKETIPRNQRNLRLPQMSECTGSAKLAIKVFQGRLMTVLIEAQVLFVN